MNFEHGKDDSDLAAVFDTALKRINRPEDFQDQDEVIPLGVVTVGQFQAALASFIGRNQEELNRMTSGSQLLQTPFVSSFSGLQISEPTSSVIRPASNFECGGSDSSLPPPLPPRSPVTRPFLSPVLLNEHGSPLCQRGCKVILISSDDWDKKLLPELTRKIYKDSTYNGKVMGSDSEMIQTELSENATCDEGITVIIFACWNAVEVLSYALDENNFERFLQKKGLSVDDSQQKIRNIRSSLAVFALPYTDGVKKDSAKISINIYFDSSGDGHIRTQFGEKNRNEITLYVEDDIYLGLDTFLNSKDGTRFVRECLRQENAFEYCNNHQDG